MLANPDSLLCHIYGMYRVVGKQGTFRCDTAQRNENSLLALL